MSLHNKKSKFLSLILRHDPAKISIAMDSNGWVDVQELIQKMPIDKKILEEIVSTDDKQRYSFSDDGTKIRANQGHSIDVDVELEEKEPPKVLYHGTAERFVKQILKEGLKPMSRKYVHLSDDFDTAVNVGKRHGKECVLFVPARNLYKTGQKFYLSKNNVWLTSGIGISDIHIHIIF